ncbi:MAG: RND family transporter, partial [Treponemataceae bacterium]|nr:RND family transporter [Treponemataceae bacterium]
FSVAIIALSAWGISRLVIDTSLVNYFPPSSKFRTDVDYVDKNFAGTNSLYFVISGEEKGAMTNPEILKAVDDMQMYLDKKYDGIGKAVSFTTFIKRMNQVMHAPMLEASDDISASYNSSDSDYAEDDWGDSTDWGDDDWGSSDDWESESTEPENVAETKVWVDPNIEYARILNRQITVQEALQLFA